MSTTREQEIIAAFVGLATHLADGDDVVDVLTSLTTDCARLLDVTAAGLLLADAHGTLHLIAASSEEATTLELLQLQRAEGPCLDCFHAGEPVSVSDLRNETGRWPHFTAAAAAGGFVAVHAVPMRLRDRVLGALNLFGAQPGPLQPGDRDLVQAMAHVASVALMQDKASADKDLIVTQLNAALTSRVLLEQAKGIIASHGDMDMEQAFAALRRYARDHNARLSEVAKAIVDRSLPRQAVLDNIRQPATVRTKPVR